MVFQFLPLLPSSPAPTLQPECCCQNTAHSILLLKHFIASVVLWRNPKLFCTWQCLIILIGLTERSFYTSHSSKYIACINSFNPHNISLNYVTIVSLILQLRKLRHREVNKLAQGCWASKTWSQDSNLGSLTPVPMFCTFKTDQLSP